MTLILEPDAYLTVLSFIFPTFKAPFTWVSSSFPDIKVPDRQRIWIDFVLSTVLFLVISLSWLVLAELPFYLMLSVSWNLIRRKRSQGIPEVNQVE
jgi:hypothetical protein